MIGVCEIELTHAQEVQIILGLNKSRIHQKVYVLSTENVNCCVRIVGFDSNFSFSGRGCWRFLALEGSSDQRSSANLLIWRFLVGGLLVLLIHRHHWHCPETANVIRVRLAVKPRLPVHYIMCCWDCPKIRNQGGEVGKGRDRFLWTSYCGVSLQNILPQTN